MIQGSNSTRTAPMLVHRSWAAASNSRGVTALSKCRGGWSGRDGWVEMRQARDSEIMRLSQPMTSTEDRACRGLLARLATVPDPRDRRGRRHTLAGVLAVAAAAVLAGARPVAATAEWAADAPPHVLAALGARGDPLSGAWQAPSAAAVRRVPARIDAGLLDHTLGAWLAGRLRPAGRHRRRAVAAGGKTLRGSADHDGHAVKLLAAMDHTDGAAVAQRRVDHTTNEPTLSQPLL